MLTAYFLSKYFTKIAVSFLSNYKSFPYITFNLMDNLNKKREVNSTF